jgi:hypothetical protein
MHFFRDCGVTDFCSCKIGIPYILYISAVLVRQSSSVFSASLRILALIAMDGMYAGFAGAKACHGKITIFRDAFKRYAYSDKDNNRQ